MDSDRSTRGRAGKHLDEEILSSYIDGALSTQEAAEARRHLAECAECARNLRLLEQTVNLLKELPPVALPRSFVLRESDVVPSQPQSNPLFVFLRGATAAVMVLLAFVLGGDFLIRSSSLRPQYGAPQIVVMREAAPAAEKLAAAPTDQTHDAQPTLPSAPVTSTPTELAMKVIATQVVEKREPEPSPTPAESEAPVSLAAPAMPAAAETPTPTVLVRAAAAQTTPAPSGPPAEVASEAVRASPTPAAPQLREGSASPMPAAPAPATATAEADAAETATATARASAAPAGKGGIEEPIATDTPSVTPLPPTATATPLPPSPTPVPATAVAQLEAPPAEMPPTAPPANSRWQEFLPLFRLVEIALLLIGVLLLTLTLLSRRRV